MKKNLIFILIFLFNVALASAVFVGDGVQFNVTGANVTYETVYNMTVDNITIGSDYLQLGSFNSTLTSSSPTTLYIGVLNVTLFDSLGGAAINNFTINVTNTKANSFTTTTGYLEIPFIANNSKILSIGFDSAYIGKIPETYGFTLATNYYLLNLSTSYIGNCTNGSIVTLNISFFDEESPLSSLIADMEIEINYSVPNATGSFLYNDEFDNSTYYEICIGGSQDLQYDLYTQYTTDNGFTHRYYVNNGTLTNTTTDLLMYNFNTTTGISDLKIIARDSASYRYYENVVAKLQRNYLAEGVWRTVQMDKSGDFGNIFFNIKEENTDYRILFYDEENNLLKQTETLKFVCTSGVCELTQLLDPYSITATTSDLVVNYTLDNATSILYIDWTDPEANNNKVEIRVSKETFTGTTDICDYFQTGSSGSVNCSLAGYSGEVLLTVLTSHSPYTPIESAWIKLTNGKLSGVISSGDQAVWTLGIMITAIGFGLWSPVAAIIAALAGLIVVSFLGLFSPLSMTFIIVAAAIGIAIGIKVKS